MMKKLLLSFLIGMLLGTVTAADSLTVQEIKRQLLLGLPANGSRTTNVFAARLKTLTPTEAFPAVITAPVFATNSWINGSRALLVVTGAVEAQPGLTLVNSRLDDVVVSNKVWDTAGSVTLGARTFPDRVGLIELNNSSVIGDAYGMRFYQSSVTELGSILRANNCSFAAREIAVETWYNSGFWNQCTFFGGYRSTGLFGTAVSFSANDYSTNVFNSCRFLFSTNDTTISVGVGFTLYIGSDTTVSDSLFVNRFTADTISAAIYNDESDVIFRANRCRFQLNGGLLLFVATDSAVGNNHNVTNNVFIWEDCRVEPPTNGVIVVSTSATNYVRGGNLRPENFSNPERVVWLDSWARTTNAVSPGVTYTNGPQPTLNSVSFACVGAATTDVPQLDLEIDQNGDGTLDIIDSRVVYDVGASTFIPTHSANFVFTLDPGARWKIATNNYLAPMGGLIFLSRWSVGK